MGASHVITLTEMNGMRGSYHYLLNLMLDAAMMIVAGQYGILNQEPREALQQAYMDTVQDDLCQCHACSNFGPTYSVLLCAKPCSNKGESVGKGLQ